MVRWRLAPSCNTGQERGWKAMPATREKTFFPNCLTSGCWRSLAITQNRAQRGRFTENLAALLTSKLSWLSVVSQAEVKQQKVRNKPEIETIFNLKFHYHSVSSSCLFADKLATSTQTAGNLLEPKQSQGGFWLKNWKLLGYGK